MRYRSIGVRGPMASVIAYGNWLTHGGYADPSAAAECVAAALDAGITMFDTADVYSDGGAYGTAPPDLDVYPNFSQTFFGPDAVDNCIVFGVGASMWWADFYCWIHPNNVVDLYYRVS